MRVGAGGKVEGWGRGARLGLRLGLWARASRCADSCSASASSWLERRCSPSSRATEVLRATSAADWRSSSSAPSSERVSCSELCMREKDFFRASSPAAKLRESSADSRVDGELALAVSIAVRTSVGDFCLASAASEQYPQVRRHVV